MAELARKLVSLVGHNLWWSVYYHHISEDRREDRLNGGESVGEAGCVAGRSSDCCKTYSIDVFE